MAGQRAESQHAASAPGNGDYEPFAEAVARHLREAIFDGRLPPGSPIRQAAVAAELGVSRIPVREALRRLENEGLVTNRPHSGARVSVLDFDECIEIYKIRERLEPLAFSESCAYITDEQVDEAERLAADLEGQTDDGPAWLEGDRNFHLALYAGVPSSRLLELIVGFWNTTQHYRRLILSVFTPEHFAVVHAGHLLMVDALRNRNARVGEELVRAAMEGSRLLLAQNRDLFDR